MKSAGMSGKEAGAGGRTAKGPSGVIRHWASASRASPKAAMRVRSETTAARRIVCPLLRPRGIGSVAPGRMKGIATDGPHFSEGLRRGG